MDGVLQMEAGAAAKVPADATATVFIRVVGRNSKGPLGTLQVPLDGKTFPVPYTITRANLREGVADFIWEGEDVYVAAVLATSAGKTIAEGKSKAKAVPVDGVPGHKTAFLQLE